MSNIEFEALLDEYDNIHNERKERENKQRKAPKHTRISNRISPEVRHQLKTMEI